MTDKIKDIINNFSDMKIIKALECCIIGDCDNCSFYETRELCPNLILFVSDLIKRQEAEVEKLKSKNSNLTSDLSSLRNDLSSAKAKIERLRATVDSFTDIGKLYSEIKAEAYREFAERVKLEFYYEFDELIPSIMSDRIDNLLKELVGEDDG